MTRPNRPIYLDNHATTPVDPRVLAAMRPWWEANFANPLGAAQATMAKITAAQTKQEPNPPTLPPQAAMLFADFPSFK
jgi:cysteine desulfurase